MTEPLWNKTESKVRNLLKTWTSKKPKWSPEELKLRQEFLQWFKHTPKEIRCKLIVWSVVPFWIRGIPYSMNVIYVEAYNKTKLAKSLLKYWNKGEVDVI